MTRLAAILAFACMLAGCATDRTADWRGNAIRHTNPCDVRGAAK